MKPRLLYFLLMFVSWMLVFFVCRFVFVAAQYFQSGTLLSFADFTGAFRYGFRLDLSATAYLMTVTALLLAVSNFTGRITARVISIFSMTGIFLVSLLTAIDVRFYKYFGYRLDVSPAKYLKNPDIIPASMTAFDFIIPIGLALLLPVLFIFWMKRMTQPVKAFTKGSPFHAALFLLLGGALVIPMRGGVGLTPLNIGSAYFSENNFANHSALNLPWNVAYSITMLTQPDERYRFMADEERRILVDDLLATQGATYPLLNTNRPDVLLLILESYTSKLIGMERDSKAVTPALNRLISEGVYFSNCYASGDRTDKGIAAILSGYPAQPLTSILNHHRKMESLPGIAAVMKEAGYQTSFYYGGDINFFNIKSYLVSGGFLNIVGERYFPSAAARSKWGVHDGVVMDTLLRHVQAFSRPFFSVMLGLTSHEPYLFPGKKQFAENDEETKFLNAAHYVDRCTGDFVNGLKQSGRWDNLLLVITADHGHQLPGYHAAHEPEKYAIPLLLLGGALRQQDTVITRYCAQTDIAAMLLTQLDLPADEFTFSRNIMADNCAPVAWYSFNDGFGITGEKGACLYDNRAGKFIRQECDTAARIHKAGKAFLQTLMNDFTSR